MTASLFICFEVISFKALLRSAINFSTNLMQLFLSFFWGGGIYFLFFADEVKTKKKSQFENTFWLRSEKNKSK